MGNIFLQLTTTQHCWVASWKALLEVLPLTSNIVTQQHFKLKKLLKNVDGSSTYCDVLQLATTKFVPWQCLRWVHEVIRATTLFNLQRNSNVVLQVAAICCSYYFTFQYRTDNFSLLTLSRLSASTVLNTSTRSGYCSDVSDSFLHTLTFVELVLVSFSPLCRSNLLPLVFHSPELLQYFDLYIFSFQISFSLAAFCTFV